MTKNKTAAAWIALISGVAGLHRFYLYGHRDPMGWSFPVLTLVGLYGVRRAQQLGLDDPLSWLLVPLLGLSMSASALSAIVYALYSAEFWNARFNPHSPEDSPAGRTGWLTVGAMVCSLLIGTTVLMSTIAFSFQHYFEYQLR